MENKQKKGLIHQPSFQDAIFVGLCSVVLLAYSLYHHYFDNNTSEWKLSPYLFPTLLAVFGLLLTVSLVADAFAELRQSTQETSPKKQEKKHLLGVLIVIAAALAYYFLMPVLHFIYATVLFLAVLFLYMGERKWWRLILLSVLTTAVIYLLFGVALRVRLP